MVFDVLMHFDQHVSAGHSRPRPQAHESGVDVSAGDQALHRRINPTVQRNVGAADVAGAGRRCLFRHDLQIVIEAGIVPCFINVPADLIAEQPSHEHVRKEMLFRCSPGQTDSQRQPVGPKLSHGMGILLRDHRCECPGHGGMVRWERRPAVKEDILEVRRNWPFASRGELHCIVNPDSIDHRFCRQHTGFSRALIMGQMPPDIHSSGHPGR